MEPTLEERFAFGLVSAILGVEVDTSGETREPGHVDAILTYETGTSAAMEVTVLCDPEVVQQWKLLQKNDFRWNAKGSSSWWQVSVGRKVRLKELFAHLPELVRLHEAHGVTGPHMMVPIEVVECSPALSWYKLQDVQIWSHTDVSDAPNAQGRRPGAVTVMPAGTGGAAGDDASAVPRWLTEQAATDPQIKSKIDKLATSGYSEQHLFLVVDLWAESFSFVHAVAATDAVPAEAPEVGAVTHVWLVPTHSFNNTYLTWDTAAGWRRRALPSASG